MIRLWKCEKGSGLVDMALTMPVFILLIMGILDLGRGVIAVENLTEAARAGARYAATAPQDTSGISASSISAAPSITISGSDVTVKEPSGTCIGQPVTVQVAASYTPITPLIGAFVPSGSLVLSGSSTMTIQYGGAGSTC